MSSLFLADMSINDILSFMGGIIDMLGLRPFIYVMFVVVAAGLLLLAIIRVARGNS